MSGVVYLDSSAIVKLVKPEQEPTPLDAELARRPNRVSSVLVRVEVGRVALREHREVGRMLAEILDRITLLPIDAQTIETARGLYPANLRSLDAIHLATALSLGDGLDGLITYDRRLAAAAVQAGLVVDAPS